MTERPAIEGKRTQPASTGGNTSALPKGVAADSVTTLAKNKAAKDAEVESARAEIAARKAAEQ